MPEINDPQPEVQNLLDRVFPGDAPSSPNSPENVAAANAAAQADINRVQAERHALEQAVRNGQVG